MPDSQKILLVTPSRTTAEIMSGRLNQSGFHVKWLSDLTRLVDTIQELRIFKVIVSPGDIQSCREKLRSAPEPVRIIVLVDDPKEQSQVRSRGADACVSRFDSPEQLAVAIHSLAVGQVSPASLRVLAVDDSSAARQMVERLLRSNGVGTVLLAQDGIEAQQILTTQELPVHAVLTDREKPRMGGLELCQWIRLEKGWQTLPVIFFSESGDPEKIQQIFDAGASDYISKAMIKTELMARLTNHLRLQAITRDMATKIDELSRANQRIEEFLAVCSHDMRNPLSVIMMHCNRLERILAAEHATEAESARRIRKSSELILKLIETLMEAQKSEHREELTLEDVQLEPLYTDLYESFQPIAAEKGITLNTLAQTPTIKTVAANGFAIRRILGNLLSNAIKFTETGGTVSFEVRLSGEHLEFSVSDSGPGIPKERIADIFVKYSSQSRPGTKGEKGTGLGLFLSRALAWQLGGDIKVTSILHKGSTFTLQIPLRKMVAVA